MKIALWIALYFVIGIVAAIIMSMSFRNVRGYSIRNFEDLKSNEQTTMCVTLVLWPIVILLFIGYVILDSITKITNRKDDDPK